jgi:Protein of unknown function (DUF1638)
MNADPLLIIACGAIAREIVALKKLNDWWAVDVQCLPPELHNRPERIPEAVRTAIASGRKRYSRIFVAYADCGTGGRLDVVLQQEGIDRLPGAHCYELFATARVFAELSEAEPGTFYLTDFLVRHFDRLVVDGLGIGRHPELATEYFCNYRRVVYLSQRRDDELERAARAIAERLRLEYLERFTGYGELATSLAAVARMPAPARATRVQAPSWPR